MAQRIEFVAGIAPQKNASRDTWLHPLTSYAGTQANMRANAATGFSFLGLTEGWSYITRRAIRSVLRATEYDYFFPYRQSNIILWKKKLWIVDRTWSLPGHPAVRRTSDKRNINVALLRSLEDPNLLACVIVIHPCPIPTVKAPDMVPAAHAAHQLYYSRVEQFISQHPNWPTFIIGDFNDEGAPLGSQIGGRALTYHRAAGDKIVQFVTIPGRLWTWETIGESTHHQPDSDHPFFRLYLAANRKAS